MPTSQSKRYLIFADESSQDNCHFMVQGGIILPIENLEEVETAIAQYRVDKNMKAELKWERVANQRYNEYKTFVDYFFSLNNSDQLHFKALIIDNHRINNRAHNAGDRDLGFFKFYYQLLLHSFGKLYGDKEIHVFLDRKGTNQSLDEFRDILNNGIASRYGNRTRPFKLIEFVDSKQHCLMQMTDVAIGALAHRKNGGHLLPSTRQAKKDLSQHVIQQAGLTDEVSDTTRQKLRFAVWNFKMR